MVLKARGPQTLAEEMDHDPAWDEPGPQTIMDEPASPFPPDVRFVLIDADAVYPLKTGLNTIGRLPDNDVVVQDACVSRRHCAIVVHAGDGCEVHDVASKNGTYVNGQRLNGPSKLASGDEIRMCNRNVCFMSRQDFQKRSQHGGQDRTQAG